VLSGQRVRIARERAKLKRWEVAERMRSLGVHCSEGYIAKVEGGFAGDIRCSKLVALARALGVRLEALVDPPTPVAPAPRASGASTFQRSPAPASR